MIIEQFEDPFGDLPEHETKLIRLLDFLRKGPVPSGDREADRILGLGLNRVAALKHELIQRGYVIEKRGYEYFLISEPEEERELVKKEIQDLYYQTFHWRSVSKKRKEFDGFRCVQCHTQNHLETHHLVYDLFHENVKQHLITLCGEKGSNCHLRMHDYVDGSQMHFPRRLPGSVIERIKRESKHRPEQLREVSLWD